MHCAAQTYCGFLSILILRHHHNFEVTQNDKLRATPLHFATINKEIRNVELLINFGADVNAQDVYGQSPLHMAIIRMSTSESHFEDYKKIIKELLFKGADRRLKTKKG